MAARLGREHDKCYFEGPTAAAAVGTRRQCGVHSELSCLKLVL